MYLPVDVLAADDFDNGANTQFVDVDKIPDGWQGLDAGPKTLEIFKQVILASKTILWNGPVGVLKWKTLPREPLPWATILMKPRKAEPSLLLVAVIRLLQSSNSVLKTKLATYPQGAGPCWKVWKGKLYLALLQYWAKYHVVSYWGKR